MTTESEVNESPVFYTDLRPTADLVALFQKLGDVLHQAAHSADERYAIVLKVLLVKIADESAAHFSGGRMVLQNFVEERISDDRVVDEFRRALRGVLATHREILPDGCPDEMGCSPAVLRQISQILCRVHILGSSPQVIQDFFMYFAAALRKIDLAQYFTPYEVSDFVVRIINPKRSDRIIDPACGTSDFLVAASRVATERHGLYLSTALSGIDVSPNAVGLSHFNLMLNGAPDAQIHCLDSLANVRDFENRYTVALCNPPFGARILERRSDVLSHFELGTQYDGSKRVTLDSQEMGLLFVEWCLRAVVPGGRVGIILPNGYLGNRSERYTTFRRWLLCNARLAACIGFPRFTFKKSGADVSASIVVVERRHRRLAKPSDTDPYPIHFNLLDSVGWNLQNRNGARLYKRDPRNGQFLHNADGGRIPDSDFERVLGELYESFGLSDAYPWLTEGWRRRGPVLLLTSEHLETSFLRYSHVDRPRH